jgi:hypothetical protein
VALTEAQRVQHNASVKASKARMRQDPDRLAKDLARRHKWQKERLATNSEYAEKQAIAKRSARYKKLYNITHEQFVEMYTRQNGRCSICRTEILPSGPNTHVDHDHDTGAVRDLLCGNCNKVLGLMKEDTGKIRAAAEYLERHAVGGDAQ